MKCFIWIRVLYEISNIYDTFIIYILFLQKKFAVKVPCEIFHVVLFYEHFCNSCHIYYSFHMAKSTIYTCYINLHRSGIVCNFASM